MASATSAYHHKQRSPEFNDLLDVLEEKRKDRLRTPAERLAKASERQDALAASIEDLNRRNQTEAADLLRENGFVDWQFCLDAVTQDDIDKWAQWRMRTPADIESFVEQGLYGSYNGLFCLPIHNPETSKVIGIHYHVQDLTRSEWFIHPTGTPAQALIIGDYTTASLILIGESNWDLDRISYLLTEWKQDPSRWCTICTRGAANASLCPRELNPDATIIALPHDDYYGDIWFADLGVHLRRSLHILKPPVFQDSEGKKVPCKDIDDWFRERDCTPAALNSAIGFAAGQRPELPRVIMPSTGVTYDRSASDMFQVLSATKEFFCRNMELAGIRQGMPTLEKDDLPTSYLFPATATSICVDAEKHLTPYKFIAGGLERTKLTNKITPYLLCSSSVLQKSLPLRLLSTYPVLIDDNGTPLLLRKGYHQKIGGILIEKDLDLDPDLTLEEAVLILTDGIPLPGGGRKGGLFANYCFATPNDYSRAIAQLINPILKRGQILPVNTDFPVDLAMADKSQSGKSHRMRITALVYGEAAYPVIVKKGGAGSLDESLAAAYCSGRLFIVIDNVRGLVDSQIFESYLRGIGEIPIRLPYRPNVVIKTGQSLLQLTSNSAQLTRDLANRSLFTNIRKQPADAPRPLPWGAAHIKYIKDNLRLYFSALVKVGSHYIEQGKPRTNEWRHSFEESIQASDWIVQHIFGRPPLMDNHQNLQKVSANEHLAFLRVWALRIVEHNKDKLSWKAANISNQCLEYGITIPNLKPETLGNNDKAAWRIVGGSIGSAFNEIGEQIEDGVSKLLIEDMIIFRTEAASTTNNHDDKWYTVFKAIDAPKTVKKPIFDEQTKTEQAHAAANTPRPPHR